MSGKGLVKGGATFFQIVVEGAKCLPGDGGSVQNFFRMMGMGIYFFPCDLGEQKLVLVRRVVVGGECEIFFWRTECEMLLWWRCAG